MTLVRAVCLTALAAPLLGVPMAAQELRFGGFVRLDRRVALADSVQLADFYNVFRPELSASFQGQAEVVMSLDLRFYDFSSVASTDELADASRHFPISTTVWEAFARVSEFLVGPLDLTVGKQRIQWGTADGLNPTDRLNAYDLSDLTDFTARVPVWAVRAEYYASPGWRIEGVWTPTAHGPVLPPGMGDPLGDTAMGAPPGPVTSWDGRFEPRSRHLRNSQYGLKVAGRATSVDFSLSYFDGFDGIPVVRGVSFVRRDTLPTSGPTYAARAWSVLPRIRVLGADVATEWRGVGLWVEGGIVFPEEMQIVTEVITGGDTVRDQGLALDRQPYATWTVGGDVRLRGGWYVNVQWAHGVFLERGAGQLHDYVVGQLERRLLRETVTLTLQGIAEVARWSNWPDQLGYGLYPEVVYSPVDNLDLSLGGLLAGGRGDALFGRLDDMDQLYVRVRASF